VADNDANKRILEVLERLDKRDDDYVNRLSGIEKHLATMNGTVAGLQQRSESHSGKLEDHTGVLSDLNARLAVVERVTEVQDAHLSADVRDARSSAWEARMVAGDVRTETIGWFGRAKQAAIQAVFIAVFVVGFLAVIGGILVAVLR